MAPTINPVSEALPPARRDGDSSGPCDERRPAFGEAMLYAAGMSKPAPVPPAVNRLLYAAAFACVFIIVVLSLLPAQEMPRTGIPDGTDHFIAYWGTGGLMALAFRGRGAVLMLAGLALVGLGGLMEVLQQLSPGRSTTWSDFLMSGGGALAGLLMGTVAARIISYGRRQYSERLGSLPRLRGPMPPAPSPVRPGRP